MLGDLQVMLRSYLDRAYPPFVYSPEEVGDSIPTFFYHSVTADEFDSHLEFLARSGYETVTCDTALSRSRGGTGPGRAVMLTFDDGLASLYDVAFPRLCRWGMKAVAYVIPAYIGRPGFITWDQCREMYESGLVDVQSHSRTHRRVITRVELTGFWRRGSNRQVPWEVPGVEPLDAVHGLRALPVFEGRSLYGASRAYVLPREFWVEWAGLRAEARHAAWTDENEDAKKLTASCLDLLAQHASAALELESASLQAEVREDLALSKSMLEEKLPGCTVRHFAFPWSQHGPIAWQVLESLGFRSAAIGMGVLEGRRPATSGALVAEILRVNGDFLPCLPGPGRQRFPQIVAKKALRRLTRQVNTVDAYV